MKSPFIKGETYFIVSLTNSHYPSLCKLEYIGFNKTHGHHFGKNGEMSYWYVEPKLRIVCTGKTLNGGWGGIQSIDYPYDNISSDSCCSGNYAFATKQEAIAALEFMHKHSEHVWEEDALRISLYKNQSNRDFKKIISKLSL